jgi:plastocyanin
MKKQNLVWAAIILMFFSVSSCGTDNPAPNDGDLDSVEDDRMEQEMGDGDASDGDESDQDAMNDGDAEPIMHEVEIANFVFSPSTLSISVGDTVRWINQDAIIHTVTSTGSSGSNIEFDSGNLGKGESFSLTFETAGTVGYKCSVHPTMLGTIIIE